MKTLPDSDAVNQIYTTEPAARNKGKWDAERRLRAEWYRAKLLPSKLDNGYFKVSDPYGAFLIINHDESGASREDLSQIREDTEHPDCPRDAKKGRPRKYTSPKGEPVVPYAPLPDSYDRFDAVGVKWLLEGPGKTIAASGRSLAALGINGCQMWQRNGELLPEIARHLHEGDTVIVCFDGDFEENPAVGRALVDCVLAIRARGVKAVVADLRPTKHLGKGFDDQCASVERAGDDVHAFISSIRLIEDLSEIGREHRIELRRGHAADALDDLTKVLPNICTKERLMVYSGRLTHPYLVERVGFDGASVTITALNPLTPLALCSHIDRRVQFSEWKELKAGPAKRPADCPERLVSTLLDRKELIAQIPAQVRGLSATPVWRAGQLVSASGYDSVSQMWIEAPEVVLPSPLSRDAAEAALACIQTDWLGEFRFADALSAAGAVGLVVSAAMRASLPRCPMFVVNKHEHGEGGSTLCKLATIVQTGREPAVITVSDNEGKELEKRIDAAQLAGEQTLVLDNWASGGVVKGTALAVLISESTRIIRILGLSKIVEAPNSQLVLVNGRNITVADDFVRRSVQIGLDTRMASPEARTFRRPDLLSDASRERGKLLADCFTIVAAYAHHLSCGGARVQVTPRNTFEVWSQLIAEALAWLGLPDISAVPTELRAADPEIAMIGRLLPAWERMCQDHQAPGGMTVKDAIAAAKAIGPAKLGGAVSDAAVEVGEVFIEATGARVYEGRAQLQPQEVGDWLKRIAGRSVDGARLWRGKLLAGAQRWLVERVPCD